METKTKRKSPTIKEYGSYPQSPYTIELQSKYMHVNPEHRSVEIDGVPHGIYEIPKGKTILVDSARYTKLFKNSGMILATLSDSSIKMFMYIHENLGINCDYVCIMREDYLKCFGYAPNNKYAYYQAIEGLLQANIMKKKSDSTTCYWINPDIIFNGDRTKLKNVTVIPPKANGFHFGDNGQ